MQSIWKIFKLIYRTAQLKLGNINSDQTADYNIAVVSYDDYNSKSIWQGAKGLWEKLLIEDGQSILDLACGTGFFTIPLAQKVKQDGKVIAVDLSSGMLQCNREKAASQNLSNITFIQSDVLSFLAEIPAHSVDGVVCAWRICYMDHGKLSQELARVIKPGGFLGLIENRASTLKDLSNLFAKVMMQYPEAMVKNFDLHFPKDKHHLIQMFCKHNFEVVDAWDGEVTFPCKNGNEVMEYVIKSGNFSGFLNAT